MTRTDLLDCAKELLDGWTSEASDPLRGMRLSELKERTRYWLADYAVHKKPVMIVRIENFADRRIKELEAFVRDCGYTIPCKSHGPCGVCSGCKMNARRIKLLEGT